MNGRRSWRWCHDLVVTNYNRRIVSKPAVMVTFKVVGNAAVQEIQILNHIEMEAGGGGEEKPPRGDIYMVVEYELRLLIITPLTHDR